MGQVVLDDPPLGEEARIGLRRPRQPGPGHVLPGPAVGVPGVAERQDELEPVAGRGGQHPVEGAQPHLLVARAAPPGWPSRRPGAGSSLKALTRSTVAPSATALRADLLDHRPRRLAAPQGARRLLLEVVGVQPDERARPAAHIPSVPHRLTSRRPRRRPRRRTRRTREEEDEELELELEPPELEAGEAMGLATAASADQEPVAPPPKNRPPPPDQCRLAAAARPPAAGAWPSPPPHRPAASPTTASRRSASAPSPSAMRTGSQAGSSRGGRSSSRARSQRAQRADPPLEGDPLAAPARPGGQDEEQGQAEPGRRGAEDRPAGRPAPCRPRCASLTTPAPPAASSATARVADPDLRRRPVAPPGGEGRHQGQARAARWPSRPAPPSTRRSPCRPSGWPPDRPGGGATQQRGEPRGAAPPPAARAAWRAVSTPVPDDGRRVEAPAPVVGLEAAGGGDVAVEEEGPRQVVLVAPQRLERGAEAQLELLPAPGRRPGTIRELTLPSRSMRASTALTSGAPTRPCQASPTTSGAGGPPGGQPGPTSTGAGARSKRPRARCRHPSAPAAAAARSASAATSHRTASRER